MYKILVAIAKNKVTVVTLYDFYIATLDLIFASCVFKRSDLRFLDILPLIQNKIIMWIWTAFFTSVDSDIILSFHDNLSSPEQLSRLQELRKL